MGQLLTLATHCINDKDFYQPDNVRCITSDYRYVANNKINVFLEYSSITPRVKNEYDFQKKVWDMYRKDDNILSPPQIKAITITFVDVPPIIIFGASVVESRNKVSGSLDIIDEQWLIKFFNKTVNHTFKAELTTYKMEYKIQCGAITEVITEEQYNTLIDTYDNVKLRLEQEFAQAKIDSRLKQYEK